MGVVIMEQYILADNSRKIFNILDLNPETEAQEWDARWQKCWDRGKDFEFLPALKGMSREYLRSLWEGNGYLFDESFAFSRKGHEKLLSDNKKKPVALIILDVLDDPATAETYKVFLQGKGFASFVSYFNYDAGDWMCLIQEKHFGVWHDPPELEYISVPIDAQPDIVLIDVNICNVKGFDVFRTLRRGIEADVPIFVLSNFENFAVRRIVQVTKMGAESVIEKKAGYLEELSSDIDDSVPISYILRDKKEIQKV
jgi:CheY-like chemotaxis protein